MAEDLLNVLKKICSTLEEIQVLRKGMPDLMRSPTTALEELEKVRDALADIQNLWEATADD